MESGGNFSPTPNTLHGRLFMKTKFFVRVLTVLVLVTIVVGCSHAVRSVYRSITQWRFESQVCEYGRQVDRDAAWAGFNLAKPELAEWELKTYKERLKELELEYQHRYSAALSFVLDPTPITDRKVDSFDTVLTDILFRLDREKSPGKEVWELCEAQGKVSCINWPFTCQGFPNADGSLSEVTYEEYLDLKKQFGPAKERMDTLLAKYAKK